MSLKEFVKTLRFALPITLPVLTGLFVLGITYGILMHSKGYSAFHSFLISAIAFCGSMQFAAIPFLLSGFEPLEVVLLSVTVNIRHLFYGIAMLDKYRFLGKIKYLLIYILCDETFSIINSLEIPNDISKRVVYLTVSLLNYFYWVVGSFIGGFIGTNLKVKIPGIDFMLTAVFAVIFLEQLQQREKSFSAILGLGVSLILLVFLGSNSFIIPSMLTILIILILLKENFAKLVNTEEKSECI